MKTLPLWMIPASFAVTVVAILGAAFYLAATTPSCEERGKHTALVGLMPISQLVGGVIVTNMFPMYECQ